MIRLFLLLSCLITRFRASAQEGDFHWRWQRAGNSLVLTGSLTGSPSRTVVLPFRPAAERFGRIYRIADLLEYEREGIFFATADTLSRMLVAPFSEMLAKARRVVVVIDTTMVGFPVEFLSFGTTELARYRPLLFRINTDALPGRLVRLRKGFVLRDTSADPENACATIQRRYPGTDLLRAHRLQKTSFRIPATADFAVLSTHGLADSASGAGLLFLNEKPLNLDTVFGNGMLQLLYIDACQQGVSRSLLRRLAAGPAARWLLAPVVSNDSGESSTRTMKDFFRHLQKSGDPALALLLTRRDLYRHYSAGWNRLDRANKALIFRAYLF
ncbi:MAG: hypothetical protein EOO16_13125 [Chitinophagaceae bacterium]|nr:MAG: hypothetical protein EOO16_13125 [Chitinophagaceae bacterium]